MNALRAAVVTTEAARVETGLDDLQGHLALHGLGLPQGEYNKATDSKGKENMESWEGTAYHAQQQPQRIFS